jgi:hypothetical protein
MYKLNKAGGEQIKLVRRLKHERERRTARPQSKRKGNRTTTAARQKSRRSPK